MKFVKWLVALVGIAALIASAGILGWTLAHSVSNLLAAANSNRSAPYKSPMAEIALTTALAAVGGLLTGIGIALPRHLRRQVIEYEVDPATGKRIERTPKA